MKKKLSVLILCFTFVISAFFGVKTALISAPVQAKDSNLLQNGDFSNNLSAWTFSWASNGSTFTFVNATDSRTNDGSGSLKIINDGNNNSCVGQTVQLEGGVEYVISGYIKIDSLINSNAGGTGAQIVIEKYGFIIGNGSSRVENANWQYYSGSFTPQETGSYRIDCRLWGSAGTVYFDDLCVQPASSIENYVMDSTFTSSLTYWSSGWSNGGANTKVEWSNLSCFDDGSGSMHIVNNAKSATQQGQTLSVKLVAGKKYIISGYIKIEWLTSGGSGGCGAFFSFGDEYGVAIGKQTTGSISSPTPWQYYEGEFTPSTTGKYTIFCRLWGSSGDVYFDNVFVKEYKEDTAGSEEDVPAPDKEITPIAIRTLKKTGIYYDLDSRPAAAAPKNVLLVANGELTYNGQEYYRVIFADDNTFGKTGYVLKTLVEICNDATVYKAPAGTIVYRGRGVVALGAIEAETYFATLSPANNSHLEIYNDVQSIVPVYVAKSDVESQGKTTQTQKFNLTLNVIGNGGEITGVKTGVTSYEKNAIVEFTVSPQEGYTYSFNCDGGIVTQGEENVSIVMTQDVVVDIEFLSILNRELYPITEFHKGENYTFTYTWLSGTTYYYGAPDSATDDGTGSLLVNNTNNSHSTLNYIVELVAHTTYVLKGKVKGSFTNPGSAGGCGVFIMVEGCRNLGQQVTNGTCEIAEWKELSGEFTPTSTGRYSVNLRLWGVSGTVYFDEISLMAVSQTEFTHTYSSASAGGRVSSSSVVGAYGDVVTVMALPNPGYKFTGWSDGVTTPYRTDIIHGNTTFTAKFAQLSSHTISYKAGEGGIVVGKTNSTANEGTFRTMVAVPNEGYVFVGWSDGVKTAMRTDYITGPISVTANFAKAATVRTVTTTNAAAPVSTSASAPAQNAQLPEVPFTANAMLPNRIAIRRED